MLEAVTGVQQTAYREILRHTLANRALFYPGQGVRCHAKGCKALSSNSSVLNNPLGEPRHTPKYVCLWPTWGFVDGDMFSHCSVEELTDWLI